MKSAEEKEQTRAEIEELLRQYAAKHLNEELLSYCLELLGRLSRKRTIAITSGRKEIWASAIICVIARLNFLYDKSNPQYITKDSICEFFGTKSSSIGQKATVIEDACNIGMADAGLCASSISDAFTFYKLPNGMVISKEMAIKLGIPVK